MRRDEVFGQGSERKPLRRMRVTVVGKVGEHVLRVQEEGRLPVDVQVSAPESFTKGELVEFDFHGAARDRSSGYPVLRVSLPPHERERRTKRDEADVTVQQDAEAINADAGMPIVEEQLALSQEEEPPRIPAHEVVQPKSLKDFRSAASAPEGATFEELKAAIEGKGDEAPPAEPIPDIVSHFGFEGATRSRSRSAREVGTLHEDAEGRRFVVARDGTVLFHEDVDAEAKYPLGELALRAPLLGTVLVFEAPVEDAQSGADSWTTVDILGTEGDFKTERDVLTYEIGADRVFPREVLAEVEAHKARGEDALIAEEVARGVVDAHTAGWREQYRLGENRVNFREIETFTIDPHDAKDFDDALSYRVLPDGNIEIGVHISDVVQFIKPGTASFREAVARGTSTYLPGTVAPMLHSFYSGGVDSDGTKYEGLMSLVEGKDRLANSVVFTFSPQGHLLSEWKGATVIRSAQRFSYEEAQAVLEGKKESPHRDAMSGLAKYARILRTHRAKRGEVNFPRVPEVRANLASDGTLSFEQKEEVETNLIVQDWMVFANEAVGRRLEEAQAREGIPGFFRVHEPAELPDLRDAAVRLGEKRIVQIIDQIRSGEVPSHIKRELIGQQAEGYVMNLLLETLQVPQEQIQNIHIGARKLNPNDSVAAEQYADTLIALATQKRFEARMEVIGELLEKARFDTENIGHFGIGAKRYAQFTSPMRRMGDVIVEMLDRERQYRDQGRHVETYNEATRKELNALAAHLTEREILSGKTEKRVFEMALSERLKQSVGEVLPIRVVGTWFSRAPKKEVGTKSTERVPVGIRVRVPVPGTNREMRYKIRFSDLEDFPQDTSAIEALRNQELSATLVEIDSVQRRARLRLTRTST